METETHTEFVARMQQVKSEMRVGSRVRVSSGWTGEVVKQGHPHNGWKIRWDNPQFGTTESWVVTAHIQEVIG
jgi:preprotein translocase subunit YajC